jgi:hypothetical protein
VSIVGRRKLGRTVGLFQAAVYKGAFDRNIARVNALTKIYDSLPAAVRGRHSAGGTDVLRAGVVLLHASLEDLLRRIATGRIPYGDDEALKQIPLLGCAPREKFFLSELARFRGRTVDEVLLESVKHHYDSSVTFNHVADIAAVLERSNIKQYRIKHLYPALDELIARRHDIVHRADILPRASNAKVVGIAHRTQALSVGKIRRWTSVTRRFGQAILVDLAQVRPVDLAAHVDYMFGGGPLPKR